MDLRVFAAVVRRFKKLVIGGFVLASLLALVSYGTPALVNGKPTIKPRGSEVWSSQTLLMLSQATFPYGRAVEQYPTGPNNTQSSPPVGDSTLPNLAPIYVRLANGTAVLSGIHKMARVPGTVWASAVYDPVSNEPLPFVTLSSTAPTAADAARLANTAATVFQSVVATQQSTAQIPSDQRVQLQLLTNGNKPKLIDGPKKTIPMLLFVTVLAASIVLAFMLENANPRVKPSSKEDLGHSGHSADRGLILDRPNGHAPLRTGAGHTLRPEASRRFAFARTRGADGLLDADAPADPGRPSEGS